MFLESPFNVFFFFCHLSLLSLGLVLLSLLPVDRLVPGPAPLLALLLLVLLARLGPRLPAPAATSASSRRTALGTRSGSGPSLLLFLLLPVFLLQVVHVVEEVVLPFSARLDGLEPRVGLQLLLHLGPRRVAVDEVGTVLEQVDEISLDLVALGLTFLFLSPAKLDDVLVEEGLALAGLLDALELFFLAVLGRELAESGLGR